MLKKEKYYTLISGGYKKGLFFTLIFAFLAFGLPALLPTVASAAGNYNITFDANGGSGGGVLSVADTTDAIPSALPVLNAGHILLGFATTPNGMPVTTYIVSGQDFTLYAIWSLNFYLISFDTQGGGTNVSVSVRYYKDAIIYAPSVSKSNYNFLGWSTTPGGQVTSSYAVQASATLYAVYSVIVPLIPTPTPTYTVAFSNQGHGSTVADIIGVTNILFTNLPLETTFGYFTFFGWSKTPTGSVLTGDYMPTANSTLYAIWVDKTPTPPIITPPVITPPVITPPVITPPVITPPVTYQITFNGTSGSMGNVPKNLTYSPLGEPLTLPGPSTLIKKGYVFSGWSQSVSGNPLYSPYIPKSNVILYALWTPVTKANLLTIHAGMDTSIPLNSPYGTPDSIVDFDSINLSKVTINGNKIIYSPQVYASGLTWVKVLLKNNSQQMIIEIPLTIIPAGPVNFDINSYTLLSSNISWYVYDKVFTYSLYVDGKNICNTNKLSCKVNEIIGPLTQILLVSHAKGINDIKSPITYRIKALIPLTFLSFSKGNLTLKATGALNLSTLSKIVNNKGFTKVFVFGKLSKFQSKVVYDKLVSLMPKVEILIIDYIPGMISEKEKPLDSDLLAATVNISVS